MILLCIVGRTRSIPILKYSSVPPFYHIFPHPCTRVLQNPSRKSRPAHCYLPIATAYQMIMLLSLLPWVPWPRTRTFLKRLLLQSASVPFCEFYYASTPLFPTPRLPVHLSGPSTVEILSQPSDDEMVSIAESRKRMHSRKIAHIQAAET